MKQSLLIVQLLLMCWVSIGNAEDTMDMLELTDELAGASNSRLTTASIQPADCVRVDLVFVIDTSGSTKDIFDDQKNLASELIQHLAVDAEAHGGANVGAIQYAGYPLLNFALNTYEKALEVKDHLRRLVFLSGVTRTGLALKHAEKVLYAPKDGGREEAMKVIVLMTDGLSFDDPIPVADRLRKDRDVVIYVIGLAPDVYYPELLRIAGTPDRVYLRGRIDDFVKEIMQNVVDMSCLPATKEIEDSMTTLSHDLDKSQEGGNEGESTLNVKSVTQAPSTSAMPLTTSAVTEPLTILPFAIRTTTSTANPVAQTTDYVEFTRSTDSFTLSPSTGLPTSSSTAAEPPTGSLTSLPSTELPDQTDSPSVVQVSSTESLAVQTDNSLSTTSLSAELTTEQTDKSAIVTDALTEQPSTALPKRSTTSEATEFTSDASITDIANTTLAVLTTTDILNETYSAIVGGNESDVFNANTTVVPELELLNITTEIPVTNSTVSIGEEFNLTVTSTPQSGSQETTLYLNVTDSGELTDSSGFEYYTATEEPFISLPPKEVLTITNVNETSTEDNLESNSTLNETTTLSSTELLNATQPSLNVTIPESIIENNTSLGNTTDHTSSPDTTEQPESNSTADGLHVAQINTTVEPDFASTDAGSQATSTLQSNETTAFSNETLFSVINASTLAPNDTFNSTDVIGSVGLVNETETPENVTKKLLIVEELLVNNSTDEISNSTFSSVETTIVLELKQLTTPDNITIDPNSSINGSLVSDIESSNVTVDNSTIANGTNDNVENVTLSSFTEAYTGNSSQVLSNVTEDIDDLTILNVTITSNGTGTSNLNVNATEIVKNVVQIIVGFPKNKSLIVDVEEEDNGTISSNLTISENIDAPRETIETKIVNGVPHQGPFYGQNRTCAAMDVAFLVDGSGSLQTDYERQIGFIREMVDLLTIDPRLQRVSLIQFSGQTRQRVELPFTNFQTKAMILWTLQRIQPMTGTTAIGAAMKFTKTVLDRRLRPAPQTLIVLISDGYSQDDASPSARLLREDPRNTLYAVGLGERNDRLYLRELTGSAQRVFVGNEKEELKQLLRLRLLPCQQQPRI